MKKSVYRESRAAYWREHSCSWSGDRADADVRAAEAAGVVWDPEESELPNCLEVDQRSQHLSISEKREAVRRYNLVPELRRIQERIAHLPVEDSRHTIAHDLLALLDGKP